MKAHPPIVLLGTVMLVGVAHAQYMPGVQVPRPEVVTPPMAPPAVEGPGATSPRSSQPLVAVGTAHFVRDAASFIELALDASRLAVTQAGSGEVRGFASRMANEHMKLRQRLRELAGNNRLDVGYPSIGNALVTGHRRLLSVLASESGDRFDRQYVQMMVQIHRQMDDQFATYGMSGENPELRRFARNALPVVERHLDGGLAMTTM